MKKLLEITLILAFGLIFVFSSCGKQTVGTVRGRPGSWVDNNTYRFRALGAAPSTLTNIALRKQRSKKAALLQVQYKIFQLFKNSRINGSVRKITWDTEQNCEIIYEVRARDLKKKNSGIK
ncbi:MAG: hypothetical protein GY714_28660 [Desulfobacterales bacterium]|nr:hypothetical protein [Desulfobacterales bacterium]MCP4163175.1 hypothetical protein [Deltaproteobacteria bacterium]